MSDRPADRRNAQRGLTLVETLVAMAILAAVAISAFALLSQGANFAASERDRLAASIVADNLVVEELLKSAAPDLGENSGEVAFAGRAFEWASVVSDAGAGLRRVELTVRLKGSPQTLARVETLKAAS
ncbi:MAG: type II secretion system minor pseudopilin GspI [Parvularculaceae bacterium]